MVWRNGTLLCVLALSNLSACLDLDLDSAAAEEPWAVAAPSINGDNSATMAQTMLSRANVLRANLAAYSAKALLDPHAPIRSVKVLPAEDGVGMTGLGGDWYRSLACAEPLVSMLGALSDPAAMEAQGWTAESVAEQLATLIWSHDLAPMLAGTGITDEPVQGGSWLLTSVTDAELAGHTATGTSASGNQDSAMDHYSSQTTCCTGIPCHWLTRS